MITADYVRTMAAYNAEMNRRIYGAALRLSDADRRADRGAFWRSIHGTLSHLYWGDATWLARFALGEPPAAPIAESDRMAADFDDLWTLRQALDAELIGWAATLAPDALDGDLAWWSAAAGRDMRRPRSLCMVQIFNHQTHHRGQVHAMLTAAGEATGATDLPFVL